ncbi:hypothetical protein MNBD_GAMMA11-2790 [hydrothermal vent metagenome]|uniref:Porin domain-containing protein n=1 Tax=hydrothermal vent metagenome TaxID=652676 RepID=A0A3B0XBS9_9ZZZZ
MPIYTKELLFPAISMLLIAQPALAVNWVEKITIKGFASAVYQQTDDPVFFNGDCERSYTAVSSGLRPLACDLSAPAGGGVGTINGVTPVDGGINEEGSFRATRIGLNINAEINEMTTVQTQLLVEEGPTGFDMNLDWGFISVSLSDSSTVRAGKIRLPVGLINEFQNVGIELPWIEAPQLFYGRGFEGSNITLQSYRGLSYLWDVYVSDWSFSSDIFVGNVDLEGMSLDNLLGYTFKADWDESLYFQASAFQGSIEFGAIVDELIGQTHRTRTFGVGGDAANFLFYAEFARVTMGIDEQESSTWYASGGYQFGDVTIMLMHQNMDKGVDVADALKNQQTINSITLRYDFAHNAALKFEISQISTDKGIGLFAAGAVTDIKPADSVNMFGMALDVAF